MYIIIDIQPGPQFTDIIGFLTVKCVNFSFTNNKNMVPGHYKLRKVVRFQEKPMTIKKAAPKSPPGKRSRKTQTDKSLDPEKPKTKKLKALEEAASQTEPSQQEQEEVSKIGRGSKKPKGDKTQNPEKPRRKRFKKATVENLSSSALPVLFPTVGSLSKTQTVLSTVTQNTVPSTTSQDTVLDQVSPSIPYSNSKDELTPMEGAPQDHVFKNLPKSGSAPSIQEAPYVSDERYGTVEQYDNHGEFEDGRMTINENTSPSSTVQYINHGKSMGKGMVPYSISGSSTVPVYHDLLVRKELGSSTVARTKPYDGTHESTVPSPDTPYPNHEQYGDYEAPMDTNLGTDNFLNTLLDTYHPSTCNTRLSNRKYEDPSLLLDHMPSLTRFDNTKEDLVCKLCDQKVKNEPRIRNNHVIAHIGVKRFKCPICPSRFSVRDKTHRHFYTEHPGRTHMPFEDLWNDKDQEKFDVMLKMCFGEGQMEYEFEE